MKIHCCREDILDTVSIRREISALKFLSPIEVRKLQIFPQRGEEAFFVSIPKPWFRNWGKPEELGIEYTTTEEPRTLTLFSEADNEKIALKKIGSSHFFEIDSDFIGDIPSGRNILLEHFGTYVKVIFPTKQVEKHQLVYSHKIKSEW